ncbi:hypothetical protein EBZ38_13390, partial [bacterium]|nr:hypothetical protein [bacterium]
MPTGDQVSGQRLRLVNDQARRVPCEHAHAHGSVRPGVQGGVALVLGLQHRHRGGDVGGVARSGHHPDAVKATSHIQPGGIDQKFHLLGGRGRRGGEILGRRLAGKHRGGGEVLCGVDGHILRQRLGARAGHRGALLGGELHRGGVALVDGADQPHHPGEILQGNGPRIPTRGVCRGVENRDHFDGLDIHGWILGERVRLRAGGDTHEGGQRVGPLVGGHRVLQHREPVHAVGHAEGLLVVEEPDVHAAGHGAGGLLA